MSRTKKWIAGLLLGLAGVSSSVGLLPAKASASEIPLTLKPAVLQTTDGQTSAAKIEPVYWRRGWGGYRGWGPRVYVGPRVYGRGYYGGYGGYGGYYQPYGAYRYGYGYPAYGYANPGYGYGYTYPNYSYGYGYYPYY